MSGAGRTPVQIRLHPSEGAPTLPHPTPVHEPDRGTGLLPGAGHGGGQRHRAPRERRAPMVTAAAPEDVVTTCAASGPTPIDWSTCSGGTEVGTAANASDPRLAVPERRDPVEPARS